MGRLALKQRVDQLAVSESEEVRCTVDLKHDDAHNVIFCLKLKCTALPCHRILIGNSWEKVSRMKGMPP